MKDFSSELKKHGLRKTTFRVELLELFYGVKSSLTADEIRKKVDSKTDKVTVYRALDAFEKNGLIHRVPDKGNLTRYALCQTECDADNHVHHHAHLICNECDETFCVEDVEVPSVKNSGGFNITSTNLTLEGVCPDCQD